MAKDVIKVNGGSVFASPGINVQSVERLSQQMAPEWRTAAIANANLSQLNQIYKQASSEARLWTILSMFVAMIGVLILFGAVIAMVTGHVSVSIVTVAGSVVSEACAALLFRRSIEANKRVDTHHDKLSQTQIYQQVMDFMRESRIEGNTLNNIVEAMVTYAFGLSTTRAPDESLKVQQFTDNVRKISLCQEKIINLKNVHNRLHILERAINIFGTEIQSGIISFKDIPKFKKTWNQATEEMLTNLGNASENMQLLHLQNSFQNRLDELSRRDGSADEAEEAICEFVGNLLDTCRTQMFHIDDQLKDQVDELVRISSSL